MTENAFLFADANSFRAQAFGIESGSSEDVTGGNNSSTVSYMSVFRLAALADARYLISDTLSATSTATLLPSGTVEYVKVPSGNYVSVNGGTINVSRVA